MSSVEFVVGGRSTAALRPENGCWWPVPISGYAPRSMSRGPRLLIRVLSNRRHSYAVDSPTLKPAGFDSSHCPTSCCSPCGSTQPSHPKDAVAAGYVSTPHRGFNVGPRYFPGVVMVQRLRPLRLRVAPWLHRPGRVFRLPAAGLYFANIEAGWLFIPAGFRLHATQCVQSTASHIRGSAG